MTPVERVAFLEWFLGYFYLESRLLGMTCGTCGNISESSDPHAEGLLSAKVRAVLGGAWVKDEKPEHVEHFRRLAEAEYAKEPK